MLSDIRTGTVKVPRPTRKTKSEQWPNSWKSPPFAQIAGRPLLLIQFSSVTLCEPMDCTWRHNSLPVHHISLWNSVQFSHSVVCNSLWPHGLQKARPSCPSPTPGAYSNSCPSGWGCHPTISSSVVPFTSHLKSFPASGSFQWLSSLHQVAKVLELQLQHQSLQWIFRTDFL